MQQLAFFETDQVRPSTLKTDSTTTFADNLSAPVHRWFRYSAGFSAAWVREVIEAQRVWGRVNIYDPFAGSGTTLLEGEFAGLPTVGSESHPFVARVARAKLLWRRPPEEFVTYALGLLHVAEQLADPPSTDSPLLQKCFPEATLSRLFRLKAAWEATADGSANSELAWLALVSILRTCSPVGTAQWQYVLPNKTKARVADAFQAFEAKVHVMAHDMRVRQHSRLGPSAILHQADARDCRAVPDGWAQLIITSPPYANNFDYADATRLEMTFLGEVASWGDLQDTVRTHLMRSCTQHVAPIVGTVDAIIADELLDPIRAGLQNVCSGLAIERQNHGGKKPYHALIAAYFLDMARTWRSLRRIAAPDALACFIIGDSAPYGVHVPVERWLGELAVASGFTAYNFEKTRDRNLKWKNRKHRVPLQEGRLWVQG